MGSDKSLFLYDVEFVITVTAIVATSIITALEIIDTEYQRFLKEEEAQRQKNIDQYMIKESSKLIGTVQDVEHLNFIQYGTSGEYEIAFDRSLNIFKEAVQLHTISNYNSRKAKKRKGCSNAARKEVLRVMSKCRRSQGLSLKAFLQEVEHNNLDDISVTLDENYYSFSTDYGSTNIIQFSTLKQWYHQAKSYD